MCSLPCLSANLPGRPAGDQKYEDAVFRARKKDIRPATVKESRRDVMLFTKTKTPGR